MDIEHAILITGSISVGSLVWASVEQRRLAKWGGRGPGYARQFWLTWAVEVLALAAICSTWFLVSRI